MRYAMIGTWESSLPGLRQAVPLFAAGATVGEAVEAAIRRVEDDPMAMYVGTGGLPNSEGDVELDAAYMDGETLRFGAVLGTHQIRNPIAVARRLSEERVNCVLSGQGAERFAARNGFAFFNLVTEAAQAEWAKERAKQGTTDTVPAGSHDTVCVIALDEEGHMGVGVSTSGLFMKRPGRIGDSPIIGSGFYCDARFGGAAATGLGEDIMRGCLSYEIVRRIGQGQNAQQACEGAVKEHATTLAARGYHREDFAVIALDANGNFGAASNMPSFPFVTCRAGEPPEIRKWPITSGKKENR